MKTDVLMTVFFLSWLLCGCSVETCMDSPANMAVTVISVIVAVACAWAMGHRRD